MTAAEELAALAEEIRRHRGCGFEPCETCTNPVPGEGPAPADLMLVGEAPGAREDRLGVPFVGAAGRLLDSLLESIDVPREAVFVTNVLKARPPGNRDPRADEVVHARPWLTAQLELVQPRVVVTLGRHALDAFQPGLKISQVHGRPLRAGGRVIVPLHHPAAALRVAALRDTLRSDVRQVRAVLDGADTPDGDHDRG